jgi:hypothetical protein
MEISSNIALLKQIGAATIYAHERGGAIADSPLSQNVGAVFTF